MTIKVVCIEQVKNLTLNKIYEIYEIYFDSVVYWLINDYGYKESYLPKYFITLAQFREDRINSILN